MGDEEQNYSVIVVNCQKCGLPLIQRLPNGLWKFKWGIAKQFNSDTGKVSVDPEAWAPIEMLIKGSIRMKCFRKKCAHWNDLFFMPNPKDGITEGIAKDATAISVLSDKIAKIAKQIVDQSALR